jgi:long-chain acyl-CoA synthetase
MKRIWLDSYAPGVPADVHSPFRSLPALIEDASHRFASRPAFSCLGTTIDYATFGRLARDFAAFLQQRTGLSAGDRIGLMMPNQLTYAVAIAGALRAGLVVVNINPLFTPRELRQVLDDSGARALVLLAGLHTAMAESVGASAVEHLLLSALTDLTGHQPAQAAASGSFLAALEAGRSAQLAAPELVPDDLAFLQYTGGTTGTPKGAMLTHGNLLANVEQNRAWSAQRFVDGAEIVVGALPMYHIYGLTINYLVGMTMGALHLLVHDPRDTCDLVAQLSTVPFSVFSGVNTLFNALLSTPGFEDLDFSSLKATYGGGMSVQPVVAEHWTAVTGTPVLEGYGLTECSPTVTGNRHDLESFSGHVGLPLPSTTVSIRDEEDEEVGVDLPGELCVFGPQVMRGYWRREAASRNTLTGDGYLRTGDIAIMDHQGHVRIVERKKDLILVSGFNVYPTEVERIAMQLAGVEEVACIAAPDERDGEVVKLLVVTAPDAVLDAAAVTAHCRRLLTPYKVPRVVEFRDSLPKTTVGKVLRRALREEALAEYASRHGSSAP